MSDASETIKILEAKQFESRQWILKNTTFYLLEAKAENILSLFVSQYFYKLLIKSDLN